jgi:hypothetical protein
MDRVPCLPARRGGEEGAYSATWIDPNRRLSGAGAGRCSRWAFADANSEHWFAVLAARCRGRLAGGNEGAALASISDDISPLPLLMKYGAGRGLTPQQIRDLLNSLGSDYGGELLSNMRDVAHKVLDSVDGDLSKLNGAPFNSQLQESFNSRAEIWAQHNGVTLPTR